MAGKIKRPIRVVVLGLLYNPKNRSFLMDWHYDRQKDVGFYRPLGGGVEFGEELTKAMQREIIEEIGLEVTVGDLLGTCENIYTFEGEKGHEVVFTFQVMAKDASIFAKAVVPVSEGASKRQASWLPADEVAKSLIYPPAVKDYMAKLSTASGQ